MSKSVPPPEARNVFKRQARTLWSLPSESIQVICSHCAKAVPGDMKWHCGYCNNDNHRTEVYSFLSKCQKCGREPKSFVCPHCGKINALDKDKDERNPAREAVEMPKPVPPVDPRTQKRQEHEARREELEREIDLAKLAAILAQTKASADAQKEKPASEKIKEDVRKFVEHTMGFI